jgi:hypothetical protein
MKPSHEVQRISSGKQDFLLCEIGPPLFTFEKHLDTYGNSKTLFFPLIAPLRMYFEFIETRKSKEANRVISKSPEGNSEVERSTP